MRNEHDRFLDQEPRGTNRVFKSHKNFAKESEQNLAEPKADVDICEVDNSDLKHIVYLVKVGTDERPASQADIDNMEKLLNSIPEFKNYRFVVTHHAVEIKHFC